MLISLNNTHHGLQESQNIKRLLYLLSFYVYYVSNHSETTGHANYLQRCDRMERNGRASRSCLYIILSHWSFQNESARVPYSSRLQNSSMGPPKVGVRTTRI